MPRVGNRDTPRGYARYLATYISSPTKIEKLIEVEFGEGRAPPLHVIAQMRFEEEQRNKRSIPSHYNKDSEAHDGEDFAPASLLPPVEQQAERVRDYITIEQAAEVIPPPANPFLGLYNTGGRVIASVAHDFEMTPAEVAGKGKSSPLVDARAVVIQLLKLHGKSYSQIGRILGGRDHTSIIHASQHFDIYLKRSPIAAASYQRHLKLMDDARRATVAQLQDNDAEICVAA